MPLVQLTSEDLAVVDFMARHDLSAASYTEMVEGDAADYSVMLDAESAMEENGRKPARFVSFRTFCYDHEDDPDPED